jgi:hypothetical protein
MECLAIGASDVRDIVSDGLTVRNCDFHNPGALAGKALALYVRPLTAWITDRSRRENAA